MNRKFPAPRAAIGHASQICAHRDTIVPREGRARRGKAQVAVGNTQLKVYHKLLSSPGMRYEDLGPDYYDRRAGIRRQVAHHVGKLGALGFEVTLCRIPEPGEAGTTQAA